MKEAESSIKKKRLMDMLGKSSFLATRMYERMGEFFINQRILTRIHQLQRRSPMMHKSKRNIETTLMHFNNYPEDIRNNSIIKRIESLMKGYIGV